MSDNVSCAAPSVEALKKTDFDSLAPGVALRRLGELVDAGANECSRDALELATRVAARLQPVMESDRDRTLLFYFEGNAWSTLWSLRSGSEPGVAWAWEAPEIEKWIVALRHARRSPGFEQLDVYQRCQVLTNLASALSNVGRIIEAIAYWDQALDLDPTFSMATAAKGDDMRYYIPYLYDDGHQQVYAKLSYDNLQRGLGMGLGSPSIENRVRNALATLSAAVPEGFFDEPLHFSDFPLGETEEEAAHRTWCLHHRLFLHPVSDVASVSAVARDFLNLPSLSGPIEDTELARAWLAIFNAMKQEYIAARLFIYEAQLNVGSHFANRDIHLVDAVVGTRYGIALERLKAGFRLAYSVLDKVGFFINSYFRLGVEPKDLSFRTIWYADAKKRVVRPEFSASRNLTLRGLFWLSKDLDSRGQPELQESLDPDAHGLADLRNALEHRLVHVHSAGVARPEKAAPEGSVDISDDELRAKAMKMLRKARASLTYLSLAVRVDQGRRDDDRGHAIEIHAPVVAHVT